MDKRKSEPTDADYEAADEALSLIGNTERPVEGARRRLAERCHKWGESRFRLMWGLRRPENLREELVIARISGQITNEQFAQIIRAHSNNYLTEEILDVLFKELEDDIDAYCGFVKHCWSAVNDPYDIELEEKVGECCERLSEKSQFSKEELEFFSGFFAESRIHYQAGIAQLKTFSAASYLTVAILVFNRLTTVWRERKHDENRNSLVGFCMGCLNALPRPQDLDAMLEHEHVLARMYLRHRQANLAEGQRVETQQVTIAVQANEVKVDLSATQPTADEAATGDLPKLSVSHWSDLAIGIDEHHKYYAITPAMELGDRFPKTKSIQLHLPGERWKTLLTVLAKSANGESVAVLDILRAWDLLRLPGQLDSDSRARPGELDSAARAELPRSVTVAKEDLGDSLRDLRRKLRKEVGGPSGNDRCLKLDGELIRAGFRVAYILLDEAEELRFGHAGSDRG
jgi:hypothetical protein